MIFVDCEFRIDQEAEEFVVGEVAVLCDFMGAFELDHAGEETEEERARVTLRPDAFIPQFV